MIVSQVDCEPVVLVNFSKFLMRSELWSLVTLKKNNSEQRYCCIKAWRLLSSFPAAIKATDHLFG